MISIIDYGLGNIQALVNVYTRLNVKVVLARSPDELAGSRKLILPGVGAFDHAMERFDKSGLREAVEDLVLRRQVPVLGICVGMQMLAASSEEGTRKGLGWIDGRVIRFRATDLPLPHMGWNDVQPVASCRLFDALETDARFYFLHSYHIECDDPANIVAHANYGGLFGCAVRRENIYGVQFHPEKSHRYGVRLLKNYAEL